MVKCASGPHQKHIQVDKQDVTNARHIELKEFFARLRSYSSVVVGAAVHIAIMDNIQCKAPTRRHSVVIARTRRWQRRRSLNQKSRVTTSLTSMRKILIQLLTILMLLN